jgi:hypothetical protein
MGRILSTGEVDLTYTSSGERWRPGAGREAGAQTGQSSSNPSTQGGYEYPPGDLPTPAGGVTRRLFHTETGAPPGYDTGADGTITFKSAEAFESYMRSTSAGKTAANASSVTEHVATAPILTVQPKQLRGPDPGQPFGPTVYGQLRPFKDFL